MIPQGCFESCAFRDNKFPLLANLFPALTSLQGWKVGKPWSQYGLSGSLGSCRWRLCDRCHGLADKRNGTDVRLLHWRIRTSKVETLFFQNASVRLHAVASGPPDGPVVVLLHGFPEFWYGWRRQIEPLAAAGFRVIVPDQRGYNLSSKPAGVAAYALTELVSDVIAIADQLGQEKIYLAGHDWGAAVAWSAALLHSQRVAKLVVLNVPHPSVMRKFLSTRPRQLLRSWYMFFFQFPWLPEALFSAFHYRVGARSLLRSSRPGTFSAEDLAQYRAAWAHPGALTGMINWYRALFRTHAKFPDKTVRVPTRILWGERDAFLLAEMAHDSLRYCTSAELFTFANATHWLQHEESARVSELLIDFFRG
jgi:pimeloyl-ACP methyl ester carboxylesterase